MIWVVTAAATAVLCFGAWWVWNEVPRYLRGTEFADFSYFASLVAVFFLLSLINPLLRKAWEALNGKTEEH